MVVNFNAKAYARMDGTYNIAGYPTCFFDGGDQVLVGGYSGDSPYASRIATVSNREVPHVGLAISVRGDGHGYLTMDVALANGVPVNTAPSTPDEPTGEELVETEAEYQYTTQCTDAESDQVYYKIDWGDGNTTAWLGPYNSGDPCTQGHSWSEEGDYDIRVISRDAWHESTWSTALKVTAETPGCCENRGNVDALIGPAGPVDVSDLTYLVAYLFSGGPIPPCEDEGNVDGLTGPAGMIDVSDLTYLVAYLFSGGDAPPACP